MRRQSMPPPAHYGHPHPHQHGPPPPQHLGPPKRGVSPSPKMSPPELIAGGARARMDAYWYVMRDESWYLPWVANSGCGVGSGPRPPENSQPFVVSRGRKPLKNRAHVCHPGGPCFQQQQLHQQQYSLHPNIHLQPPERNSHGDGRNGRLDNIHHQYSNGNGNSNGRKSNQPSHHVSLNYANDECDYDFPASPHPSHSSAETIVQDDGRDSSTDTYTSTIVSNGKERERHSSLSDYDGEEEENHIYGYTGANSTNNNNGTATTRTSSSGKTSAYHTNSSGGSSSRGKHSSKLRRRKACYRAAEKKDGRSRSLTHIDNLDPAMLLRAEDMDSKSEPDTSHDQLLYVPNSGGCGGGSSESRRKKLTRSQVSSNEFYSVSFEGELGSGIEEFLPVTHGTCLGDALRPLFERKGINISNVNIFVDSSKTPLPSPASTDTHFVAGKNLTVRVKEPYHKFHSRSFKQPSRKSSSRSNKSKFFSSSTEDSNYGNSGAGGSPTLISSASLDPNSSGGSHNHHHHQGSISHEGSLKVKSTKQSTNRWSGLFSNSFKDNSKMDLLVEQLNSYSTNGIPRPAFLPTDTEEIQSIYSIEEDWKCIVPSWKDMSERSIQQQTAIWELVETEVVYLRTVKVITDLFLACLYNLQSANILNEIDRDQLFSNIPEIYKSNNLLWLDCFLPMVQKARETKQPLQPTELRNGFLRFGSTCQPYTKYCLDQTKCQQYCREKYQENEYFKAYLVWCETRKECNRLRLMDILVRPMQRMTKYSLLLKAILKHTEDLEQRKCTEEMILSVERFVRSVNGALKSREDTERLQGIAERIDAYDVVETREDELESIVKSHSRLNLFQPMPGCATAKRSLLYECDLKIKDSFTSKMDAHCFLFTDMLLICKPVGRKGERVKVIRQPYVVDRLITRELSRDPCSYGLVYLNEYGTASAALSLHFNELKLVKAFTDHMKKAQKLYLEAKEKEHTEYPEDEDENEGIMYLNSRSGRVGSSRASQLSSLIHSHSGSVEMNEVSVSSRGVSFENELRGSSLSSDDGNGNESSVGGSGSNAGVSLMKSRSLSTDTGPGVAGSPRRVLKSPSPNTLSVNIPTSSLSGQSLPNLPTASESSSPPTTVNNQHHSLTVPKSLLSPTHRGISYPPPSPRSLRRSFALLQSRNPPLQKSHHIITSPDKSAVNLDVQVPEIRGVIPPSNDVSPVVPQPPLTHSGVPPLPVAGSDSEQYDSIEYLETGAHDPGNDQEDGEDEVLIVHQHHHCPPDDKPDSNHYYHHDSSNPNDSNNAAFAISKRLARNDRSDTKRYYTAGVIEDIKKESNRDVAIHKRLSWNYGPQQQQQQFHQQSSIPSSRQFFSSESMTSVRSSSGVSSTSSLLHCISDLEPCSTAGGTMTMTMQGTIGSSKHIPPHHQQPPEHDPPPPPAPKPKVAPKSPQVALASKQLPNVRIALCESPSDPAKALLNNKGNKIENDLHEISNHIEAHFAEGKQCKNCSWAPVRGANNEDEDNDGRHFDKSSDCSSVEDRRPAPDCKSEQFLIRDFILTDASMEASEV